MHVQAQIHARIGCDNDCSEVYEILRKFGESNVDIRDREVVEAAISTGSVIIFQARNGRIVGVGALYPYHNGALSELGSSVWIPEYRGLGAADISLILRSVRGVLFEPGTVLVSELYLRSFKSERVLQRWGFERLLQIPEVMERHAFEANAIDEVKHYALSPQRLPAMAKALLAAIDGEETRGGLTFTFDPQLFLQRAGMRRAIVSLSEGALGVAGFPGEPVGDLDAWVRRCVEDVDRVRREVEHRPRPSL